MAVTKRWKDRSRYRHCLFKRHRVCLHEEMNTRDISVEPGSRENANKDSINRLLLASYLLISSFEKLRIICISRSLSGILVQMPHCKTGDRALRVCPVNFDFCPEFSFKCRTVRRDHLLEITSAWISL